MWEGKNNVVYDLQKPNLYWTNLSFVTFPTMVNVLFLRCLFKVYHYPSYTRTRLDSKPPVQDVDLFLLNFGLPSYTIITLRTIIVKSVIKVPFNVLIYNLLWGSVAHVEWVLKQQIISPTISEKKSLVSLLFIKKEG